MLQPERRRREGQGLPDVWRSIIPCFRIFSVFLVFLNSLVFCVVSTVLRVRCYLHLRWYYFSLSNKFSISAFWRWWQWWWTSSDFSRCCCKDEEADAEEWSALVLVSPLLQFNTAASFPFQLMTPSNFLNSLHHCVNFWTDWDLCSPYHCSSTNISLPIWLAFQLITKLPNATNDKMNPFMIQIHISQSAWVLDSG